MKEKLFVLLLCLAVFPAALHAQTQPVKYMNYAGYNPFTGRNDMQLNMVYQFPDPARYGAGPYPVFVWVPGTFASYRDLMSLTFVMNMSARGFVAASVQYNYALMIQTCWEYQQRADSIFESARADSAMGKLCAMSGVNCGKGIVTAGQSQGAALAIMAKNYEPNVQATLGMSVSDTFQWLGLSLWCLDKQYTAIPSNRLMIVNGEDDFYYGGQLPVERVSGLSCPSGSSECWSPDGSGSGWYLIQDSEVTDGNADHCYQMVGDCVLGFFDPIWFLGTADWSLKSNLDWLATLGTKRIFAPGR